MRLARTVLKHAAAQAFFGVGGPRWFARGKTLFLLFHRVLPAAEAAAAPLVLRSLAVTVEDFRNTLAWFRNHFEFVDLRDYLKMRSSQEFPIRPMAVVTFDDGWVDNYTHAWPVLRELDIPATFFVTTGLVGSGETFWWQAIGEGLLQVNNRADMERIFRTPHPARRHTWEAALHVPYQGDPRRKAAAVDAVLATLKDWPVDELREVIRRVAACLPETRRPASLMDWPQMAEMSGAGRITFASHGFSHWILPRLALEEAEQDIRQSWQLLKEHPEVAFVPVFSYPNGDYSEPVKTFVRRAGFAAAFGIRPGLEPAGREPDLYALGRANVDARTAAHPALRKWLVLRAALNVVH